MDSLARRIKELRTASGLTQSQLAKNVGVSSSAVSQWESGLVKGLKGVTLVKVAAALGVESSELYGPMAMNQSMSSDEQEILGLYRSLPSGHKEIARKLLKALK